jgi:Tfp pilus assembly protein PilX
LVVSLLVVLVIALIAVAIAVSTRGGERVATAFQNQQRAFEAALAGLEDAREQLRLARYNTALTVGNYNSQLAQAANGGTLVNSTRLLNFGATNGFTNGTLNTPFLGATSLDSASYEILLTNAALNGETVTTRSLSPRSVAARTA